MPGQSPTVQGCSPPPTAPRKVLKVGQGDKGFRRRAPGFLSVIPPEIKIQLYFFHCVPLCVITRENFVEDLAS